MGIEKLVRKDLLSFGGYSAATSPETLEGKLDDAASGIVKLDANENPYGCSPRVAKALSNYRNFNIYPDDGQERLRKLLADFSAARARQIVAENSILRADMVDLLSVDASRIVAGGGSNQLIDLLVRLFVEPGDEVINCPPTFGLYSFSTRLNFGKLVEVPRAANFSVDPQNVVAAVTSRTKLIFLANPNNPTGNLMPLWDIEAILKTGVPIVVDEAYYEFCGQTALPFTKKYDNLIILRTFSKWAGLAGLRIGYGIFPPEIVDFILRIKIPYNVNVAALVAVDESLKDIDYLMGNVKKIIAERDRLFAALQTIDWLKPYPSQANFILCQMQKGRAEMLHHSLQRKGILVRYFDQPRLQDCIRISVGTPTQTDALIKALRTAGG